MAIIALIVISSISVYLLLPKNVLGSQGSRSGVSSSKVATSGVASQTSQTGASIGTSVVLSNYNQAWLTYHNGLSRNGFDPNEPSALTTKPSLDWKSATLDGAIYAEPLVYNGMLIAATENNSVYALNVTSGQIIWHVNLGKPVDGSSLPCGDINPSGITGTPVIDGIKNTVYVVAYLNHGGHELFTINLENGGILFQRNVDPPSVSVAVEQQRGALALSRGVVYIPYGGLDGDCGQYHGFVIGVPENNSYSNLLSYQVPTGREGGIWATSGVAIDSAGNIYAATGNSQATTNFDFGDSLVRLSPTLKEVDYFAPSNWAALNSGDTDLGSVGPTILDNQTIFQIGKQGVGYLLNTSDLGGVGGQEFSAKVCSGGAYGGTAYADQLLFVPCSGGLVSLAMNLSSSTSHSFAKLWEGPGFRAGPPIVAGNAVWVIDTDGGTLYALNENSGNTLFSYKIGSVAHFSTPSSADGRIFVAADNAIEAIMI